MRKLKNNIWLIFALLAFSLSSFSQNGTIITGQVKDGSIDESLVGVNVVEVDANGRFVSGIVTDINGNFILKVSNPNATIQVSYLGYTKQVIELNGRTKLDITLESDATALEEVVVTAEKMSNDGVIAVRDRGTAVTRVELKGMEEMMTTSVEEMLQGRVGNVDITAVSGDPGAGLNIRIRGTATLNANNNPMILVNGTPYNTQIDQSFNLATADLEAFGSLIDVSPESIEAIEVLKDAASTAEWGSKAANGIISIKTKRGIKSPPKFEYTYKLTRAKEPASIPMLNGPDYARLIKMEHFNVDAMSDFNDLPAYLRNSIDFNPDWEEYDNYAQTTNWIDEITRIAKINQHNFSVRGGGEKTRYNVQFGYDDEEGTTIGTSLQKLSFSTALDYDISSKLTFKTDVMFTRRLQTTTYDNKVRGIAYRKMPNMSVYQWEMEQINDSTEVPVMTDRFLTPLETIQGSAYSMYNPVAFIEYGQQNRNDNNTRANFELIYRISPVLKYQGSITMDLFDKQNDKFLPYEAIGASYGNSYTNESAKDFAKKTSISTMNRLVYTPALGDKHEMTGLLKMRTESTADKSYFVRTTRSASRNLTDASGEVDIADFGSGSSSYRYLSTFAQVNYIFLDQHIFMASGNFEGSSQYSEDSRFGIFPAVSYAFRMSNSRILRNISFIDDFKPRISWGISGNSPGANYLYFNSYSASSNYGYNGVSGIRPDKPELTGLKWETIEQLNPGITIAMFNYRFNFEFDYYSKHTRNLYQRNYRIPSASGYGSININEGEMLNSGWEIMTDFTPIQRGKWYVNFNFNVSHNENKVLEMPENYEYYTADMDANGSYLVYNTPGNAIGSFYGYDFVGVFVDDNDVIATNEVGNPIYDIEGDPIYMAKGNTDYEFQPGDAKYRDVNYDGVIDELDIVYLGNMNPDIMGGFGAKVKYAGITINAFFHYKTGRQIINGAKMDTEKMYGYDNQSTATKWAWQRVGDTTHMPRALFQQGYNWLGSDRFVEEGDFLRFKSASLSYDFPKPLCQKLNLEKVNTYVTVYNLFTYTNYSGQDPDIGPPHHPTAVPMDKSTTPPSKRVIIGLRVTF